MWEVYRMASIRGTATAGSGETMFSGLIFFRSVTRYFSDICYEANCQFPQKFPEYKDNLYRLGLIEVYYDRHLVDDSYYQDLIMGLRSSVRRA